MYVEFKVDDRPLVCWDQHLDEKNLEYLQGVDTSYFGYVLDANMPNLDGDNMMQAALAIRFAYYQALEALFALLSAAIQAPNCVVGWNLAYRNFELVSVVEKVSSFSSLYSHSRYRPVSWDNMATHVFTNVSWPQEKLERMQKGFGSLWSGMAREFVDPKNLSEYNALKHGLRPRPGGFNAAVGVQADIDTPCPPGDMQSLGGSVTGSSYFLKEPIGKLKHHFRPRRVGKNWNVANTVNGLALASMSIEDVVSFLRIENGDEPKKCRFRTPDQDDAFSAPWKEPIGALWNSMDTVVSESDIMPWTVIEVEQHLNGNEEAS